MPLSNEEIYDRVDYLRAINSENIVDRARIRDIMNGGEAAVRALLGNSINVEYLLEEANRKLVNFEKERST